MAVQKLYSIILDSTPMEIQFSWQGLPPLNLLKLLVCHPSHQYSDLVLAISFDYVDDLKKGHSSQAVICLNRSTRVWDAQSFVLDESQSAIQFLQSIYLQFRQSRSTPPNRWLIPCSLACGENQDCSVGYETTAIDCIDCLIGLWYSKTCFFRLFAWITSCYLQSFCYAHKLFR